jgi:hypothetical protein
MPSEKTLLGIVVDNADPLYQGRAKIKVFGFFEDVAVEDIPWAEQIAGLSFGGEGGGGNITIPRVGSVVSVHFEEHNYYKMTYHYVKEISPDLLEKLKEENCYDGTHSLIYDSEARPGPLHVYYTYKDGLMFELDNTKIQIDTQNGGEIRIVLKRDQDEIRVEKDLITVSSKKVVIDQANLIELGKGASENLVLGNSFLTLFNTHTHIGNLGAPTSPPITPMTPVQHLSGKGAIPAVKTV